MQREIIWQGKGSYDWINLGAVVVWFKTAKKFATKFFSKKPDMPNFCDRFD